jgi:leucyl-tRNA synthetase
MVGYKEGKIFEKEHQNISKKDQKISKEMVGWFPLSEQNLPLKLPYVKSYEPTETGDSPLSAIPEYVLTTCPHCGGKATRETDTMPNWLKLLVLYSLCSRSKFKN